MNESMLLSNVIKALYPWVKLHRANVGTVVTNTGRKFSTGLPKGFPDLFGTLPASKSRTGTAVPVTSNARWAVDPFGRSRKSFWQRKRPTALLWV